MDGATLWTAIGAIGTCAGAAVAIMGHLRKSRPDTQPSASPLTASPVPVPAPLQTPAPQGTPVLHGTTVRKKPRQLDLVVRGGDLSLFMHPPGNRTAGVDMIASIDEIRRRWMPENGCWRKPETSDSN
jgi:hypothetical protein